MAAAIKVNKLVKRYADTVAVNGISFEVERGSFFCFLGVNGAGKSTTINCICHLLDYEGGSIEIDNCNTDENTVKSKLGVVFQSSKLDPKLSLIENLYCRGAAYGLSNKEIKQRIIELNELLSFKEFEKKTIEQLSGGQKRKCDIARALIGNPSVLILDEPTTGLDPATRKALWACIERLRKTEEMTVFLTTHYMEEANQADKIVVINKGEIVAEGTPLELKNRYVGDYINIYNVEEETVKSFGYKYEKILDGYRIEIPSIATATKLIVEHHEIFQDYEIEKGKLDDVFLAITGSKGEN